MGYSMLEAGLLDARWEGNMSECRRGGGWRVAEWRHFDPCAVDGTAFDPFRSPVQVEG